jgi:glycosyltransferase A (GT-A) superfamily protein (DUF2064 family)
VTAGTLLILAKAPVPGQVKTRLCPPCTAAQAADVAAACLADTLDAVRACGAGRRVLALGSGPMRGGPVPGGPVPGSSVPGSSVPGSSVPGGRASGGAAAGGRLDLGGLQIIPQRGAGLAERIATAFAETAALGSSGRGVVQIGMDSPQVTPDLLDHCLATLSAPAVDAVLGPAEDGGWWAMGLRDPAAAALIATVPMSTPDTGRLTRQALLRGGLRVALLPVLRDVDHWADAVAVAAAAPAGRLAVTVAAASAQFTAAGAAR